MDKGWRRKKRWEVMKTVADNGMENERRRQTEMKRYTVYMHIDRAIDRFLPSSLLPPPSLTSYPALLSLYLLDSLCFIAFRCFFSIPIPSILPSSFLVLFTSLTDLFICLFSLPFLLYHQKSFTTSFFPHLHLFLGQYYMISTAEFQ